MVTVPNPWSEESCHGQHLILKSTVFIVGTARFYID